MSKKTTNNVDKKMTVIRLADAEVSIRRLADGLDRCSGSDHDIDLPKLRRLADKVQVLQQEFTEIVGVGRARLPELDRKGDPTYEPNL